MNKIKIAIIIFLVTGTVVAAVYFNQQRQPQEQKQTQTQPEQVQKITLVTTMYPLAEFAKQVGKDAVAVTQLVPPGAEPHSFEPTPQDILQLQNAQIVIYNGVNFEPWLDKIKPELEQKGVTLIEAAKGIQLREGKDDHEDDEHSEDEQNAEAVTYDPHIWVDPVRAQQMTDTITLALKKIDGQNEQKYDINSNSYKNQLARLDAEYKTGLQMCAKREIIASHNAFGYLADRYNFTVIPISGLSPEDEPTPQKLAEITQIAKQKKIKFIFFEALLSPRLSDTIAKEVGAQTLVLNPIEGLTQEQIDNGENYITVQKQNLQNLKTALECS